MSKIEFRNDLVKNRYQYLVRKYKALPSFIQYIRIGKKDILIDNITNGEFVFQFDIKNDDNETNIIIVDLLKGRIYIKTNEEERYLVYHNIKAKNPIPIGYYTSFNNVNINETFLFQFNNMDGIRHFEVEIKEKKYVIIIDSDEEYNEMPLFNILFNNEINNINDLYEAIINNLDVSKLYIKLGDSINSSILINNGETVKYEVYNDEIEYMKKLGEKNG